MLPRSSHKDALVKDRVQQISKHIWKGSQSSLDVPALKVIDRVNDQCLKALDYRTYLLIKKSRRYDDDETNELHHITRTFSNWMKDRNFSGKNLMSINSFLQYVKYSCDACDIYESAAM